MSQWISVNEENPDEDVVVIGSGFVYGKPEMGRWVEPVIFSDYEFHSLAYGESDGEVMADHDVTMSPTHWIPLPKAPTE